LWRFRWFHSVSWGESLTILTRKCLVYNPKKRMTVEQGLVHPYVKEFKGTEDEIVKGT
jgi:hypothetical protein